MTKWLCSADSHVIEPHDTWLTRMPRSMRERAPRYEVRDGNLMAVIDGRDTVPIPVQAFALPDGTTLPPGDAPSRIELLDQDGVWAEALIGNLAGTVVFGIEEPAFAMECARAYNDWLAESFVPYGNRQVGIAFVPVCGDISDTVKEIERVKSLGLRGFTLPLWPPEPYYLAKFEPIWEAAEALGLPISFHAHTGTYFKKVFLEPPPQSVQEALRGDPRAKAAIKTAAGFGDTSMQGYQAYQVSAWLVGSGVLDRHPTLHFVFVECGAGWLVWALDALDFAWEEVPGNERIQGMKDEGAFGDLQSVWSYPLLPSEYIHRQIHATFQDEPAAVRYRKDIGIDQLMWGSDFPHPEGTWPHSQEFVARRFASVEEPERSAILHGNFAKLYGIDVPK